MCDIFAVGGIRFQSCRLYTDRASGDLVKYPCRRIGKESEARRMVSKEKKTDKENAHQDAEYGGKGFCLAGQREPVKEQKRSQGAYDKGANIKNKIVSSQNAGVGVEKNRDEQGSRQYSQAQGGDDAGVIFFQMVCREKSIQQHREKQ